MVIQKQAINWAGADKAIVSFFTKTVTHLKNAPEWAAKWGKATAQAKYLAKPISFLGKSDHVIGKINALAAELAKSLEKINIKGSLEALGKTSPEKLDSVIKAASSGSKGVGELLTKSHQAEIINNVLGKSMKVTPESIDAGMRIIESDPIKKAKYLEKAAGKIAEITTKTSTDTSGFFRMLSEGITLSKEGKTASELASIAERISIIEKEIATTGNLEAIVAEFKIIAGQGSKFTPQLTDLAQTLTKNKAPTTGLMILLKDSGALATQEANIAAKTFTTALTTFKFVDPMHALSLKNVKTLSSAAGLILFGSAMIGGGLIGENVKLFKEVKPINEKIIDELNKLPAKTAAVGEGWTANKERIIAGLRVLDPINITAFEQANGQNMSAEDMQKTMAGLEDLSNRFATNASAFEALKTPFVQGSYENGSQGIASSVGASIDNLNPLATFGLTGHIDSFNTIKSLAEKGLQALQTSGEKIAQSSEQLNNKMMEGDMGGAPEQQAPAPVTAEYIMSQFVATGSLLDMANSYREIDRIESYLLKKKANAGAVGAILGAGFTVGETIGETANVLTKAYVRLSDSWDKLDANFTDVLEMIRNFNEFEPSNPEGVKFKSNTAAMISSMENNIKNFKTNFPLNEKGDIDKVRLEALEKEMGSGNVESKAKLVNSLTALENLSLAYQTFMSTRWEEEYSKNAKSWWQSGLTGFGMVFTLFSGESIIDAYSRMMYKAKPGAAMLADLIAQLKKALELDTKNKYETRSA